MPFTPPPPMPPPPPTVLVHDHRHVVRASVGDVWAHLAQPERFPVWWRWLRDFEVAGGGLTEGAVLSGMVAPPVPYRFHVRVRLDEVAARDRIVASITGDLEGPASVRLRPVAAGCEIAVRWEVDMRKPSMRAASRVARPLLVWGHDQVVATTVRRFRGIVEPPPGS